jgi:DNA-3-methyladenine glycosylase II
MTVESESSEIVRVLGATRFALRPQGRFDLGRSATFGFGQRDGAAYDGRMPLAFCLDGYQRQVGVIVSQDRPDAMVLGEVRWSEPGSGDIAAVANHTARALSLDQDARGFDEMAAADPLLAPLAAAAPGLRPPLFYSAYEAAAWAVLSARRPRAQMSELRRRLATSHGTVFRLADQDVAAFPTPDQLLRVRSFPGLPEIKLRRLHAVAQAALDGLLDTAALRRLDPAEAVGRLRQLPGIGPFYADLVVVRALGHTDVIPTDEPLVRSVTAELLRRDELTQPEFEMVARAWRPWRTWSLVLVRAVGARGHVDANTPQS